MKKKFKNICIDREIIKYGERCNIITFNEEIFNEYQLSALSKQHEKLGFLKCACKYKDEDVDIYYYTTDLISIDKYFSQMNIKKTEFVSIIKTICQSIKLCSNYAYFNKNNLILDEELIYINPKDKSIHIMYVPISTFVTEDVIYDLNKVIINLVNNNLMTNTLQESFNQEILDGLRNHTFNIDELITFLDELINRVNSQDIIKQKIEKTAKPKIEPIKVEEFKSESFTSNMDGKHQENEQSNKGIKGFLKKMFSSSNDYKKTSNYNNSEKFLKQSIHHQNIDDGSDDTVILGCNSTSTAYLIADNDNYGEKVIINKDSFVVGRLKNVVDYEIINKTIGKIHAKFIKQDNKYYLVDLESKNGTYINSAKLQPNSLYEIEDEASIVFSNVKYKFKIEK